MSFAHLKSDNVEFARVPTRSCPWEGWKQPNVDWCEEHLCSIVSTPSNTWSNLAYVAAGIYMVKQAGRSKDLQLFGPAAMATGVFSGLYHASHSEFFQLFDFIGMYMFCMLPVVINCRRLGMFPRRQQNTFYAVGVAACTALTPLLTALLIPIQLIVVLLVAFAGLTELKAFQNAKATAKTAASAASAAAASHSAGEMASTAAAVALSAAGKHAAERTDAEEHGDDAVERGASGSKSGVTSHLGFFPAPRPPSRASFETTAAYNSGTDAPQQRSRTTTSYYWFAVGVCFLAVGLTCSMLDLQRIWCNPKNHVVQGHAVWHIFTALALMCQFQHYTQFQHSPSAPSSKLSADASSSATKQDVALGAIRAGVGAILAAKERLRRGGGSDTCDGGDSEGETGGAEGGHNRYKRKFIKSHRRAISVDVESSGGEIRSGGSLGLVALAHRRNQSYDALRLL